MSAGGWPNGFRASSDYTRAYGNRAVESSMATRSYTPVTPFSNGLYQISSISSNDTPAREAREASTATQRLHTRVDYITHIADIHIGYGAP